MLRFEARKVPIMEQLNASLTHSSERHVHAMQKLSTHQRLAIPDAHTDELRRLNQPSLRGKKNE